jgi:hypothetical protein
MGSAWKRTWTYALFYIVRTERTDKDGHDKLKKSTLYISAKDLGDDVQTADQIKKFYSGPVKIVTDDEIFKLIDATTPTPDVLYVEATRPPRSKTEATKERVTKNFKATGVSLGSTRRIIDPNNLWSYFYEWREHTGPASVGFTGKDFKELAKKVK